MYLIPVILLIVVAGMWVTRKQLPPAAARTAAILVTLVAVIWAIGLLRPHHGGSAGTAEVFDQACGFRAGQWIAERSPGPGQVVFLDSPLVRKGDDARRAAQLDGLREALEGTSLEVQVVELTSQDMADTLGGDALPISLIADAAARSDPCAAVVLAQGVPVSDGQRRTDALPPVIALSDPDPPLRQHAMRLGLLSAVATLLPGADRQAEPSRGATLDEVFALRYQWVSTNAP